MALAAAWWWQRAPAPGVRATAAPAIADAGGAAGASALARAAREDPRVQDYERRQAFEAQARRFFKEARGLRPVARSEQARALSAQIDGYEAGRALSAGEALVLRIGLIQATVDDPAEQAARVAALGERYREAASRREAAYEVAHRNDPRFRDYKAREAEIVAEVMALPTIPGGVSRDEYLRERLQDARMAAYR